MPIPLISFYEANNSSIIDENINPDNFGAIQAGAGSANKEIHIINNKGGSSNVSKAENVRITTVTLNLLESGDTIPNGKEIVEMKMIGFRSLTNGDSEFTSVGGVITKELGDIRGDKLATPAAPSGVISSKAGATVPPGVYKAKVLAGDDTGITLAGAESGEVLVSAMKEVVTEDSDSETLDSTTNTKLSWQFTSDGTKINGIVLKQAGGGNLIGNVRIETDNSGEPSGTLVHSNAHLENVELLDPDKTVVWFADEAIVTTATVYHVVFNVISGIGSLRGTTTGTADMTKFYNGTWNLSAEIENLFIQIIGNNKIDWSWPEVVNATMYQVYRRLTTGDYVTPCKAGEDLSVNSYEDLNGILLPGIPPTVATVTYEHIHQIERKMNIPSYATAGLAECYTQLRYLYI
jgi:hypothetical protein